MTDEQRERAIARIKAKRDFWGHVATYLIVNTFLVILWLITSDGGYFWPIWSIVGWGIGLLFHAYNVFFEKPISEDQIQREIDKGP